MINKKQFVTIVGTEHRFHGYSYGEETGSKMEKE